jgi:adenine-specific DNA-methyltransferase
LGGPEFASFRKRVLQLAEVLVIDLIEKRSDVLLDAIQDACFVVFRRRPKIVAEPDALQATSGVFRRDGKFLSKGIVQIEADGAPWRLPGIQLAGSSTLKDWRYRATVGYLVANRQPERLHERAAKGRYPLIWAKAISTDGTLVAPLLRAGVGRIRPQMPLMWFASHVVAVQRTSSRGQKRRLNAAPVLKAFIRKYGGVIAENHVILLAPAVH